MFNCLLHLGSSKTGSKKSQLPGDSSHEKCSLCPTMVSMDENTVHKRLTTAGSHTPAQIRVDDMDWTNPPYAGLPEQGVTNSHVQLARTTDVFWRDGDARVMLHIPIDKDHEFVYYLSTGTSHDGSDEEGYNFPYTCFPNFKNELTPHLIKKEIMPNMDMSLLVILWFTKFESLNPRAKPNDQGRLFKLVARYGSYEALQVGCCFGGVWDENDKDIIELKQLLQTHDYIKTKGDSMVKELQLGKTFRPKIVKQKCFVKRKHKLLDIDDAFKSSLKARFRGTKNRIKCALGLRDPRSFVRME